MQRQLATPASWPARKPSPVTARPRGCHCRAPSSRYRSAGRFRLGAPRAARLPPEEVLIPAYSVPPAGRTATVMGSRPQGIFEAPDTTADSLRVAALELRAASVRGRSHRSADTPRQDHYSIGVTSAADSVVVAGGGRRRLGRVIPSRRIARRTGRRRQQPALNTWATAPSHSTVGLYFTRAAVGIVQQAVEADFYGRNHDAMADMPAASRIMARRTGPATPTNTAEDLSCPLRRCAPARTRPATLERRWPTGPDRPGSGSDDRRTRPSHTDLPVLQPGTGDRERPGRGVPDLHRGCSGSRPTRRWHHCGSANINRCPGCRLASCAPRRGPQQGGAATCTTRTHPESRAKSSGRRSRRATLTSPPPSPTGPHGTLKHITFHPQLGDPSAQPLGLLDVTGLPGGLGSWPGSRSWS